MFILNNSSSITLITTLLQLFNNPKTLTFLLPLSKLMISKSRLLKICIIISLMSLTRKKKILLMSFKISSTSSFLPSRSQIGKTVYSWSLISFMIIKIKYFWMIKLISTIKIVYSFGMEFLRFLELQITV